MFFILCVFLCCLFMFFFFKQKTAYEMRISDWSSDVCSSDLQDHPGQSTLYVDWKAWQACAWILSARSSGRGHPSSRMRYSDMSPEDRSAPGPPSPEGDRKSTRLQSLMRISYAVFCLKKKILTI